MYVDVNILSVFNFKNWRECYEFCWFYRQFWTKYKTFVSLGFSFHIIVQLLYIYCNFYILNTCSFCRCVFFAFRICYVLQSICTNKTYLHNSSSISNKQLGFFIYILTSKYSPLAATHFRNRSTQLWYAAG